MYGRRIIEVTDRITLDNYYVVSGQWTGHRYGQPLGTNRQRNILVKNAAENLELCLDSLVITRISEKIFWGLKGISGDKFKGDVSKISFVKI